MEVADKLRGTFKQHEYGAVMLPLLVLRRMDAVLAPTKDAVLAKVKTFSTIGHGQEELLKKVAGCGFYNVAPWTFATLLNDDKNLADSLARYVRGLSRDAYRVMDAYNVDDKIARLDRAGLLYAVLADFATSTCGPRWFRTRRWAGETPDPAQVTRRGPRRSYPVATQSTCAQPRAFNPGTDAARSPTRIVSSQRTHLMPAGAPP